jgi:protein-S-isoprenylcysteine O-methyltransferase Ste14
VRIVGGFPDALGHPGRNHFRGVTRELRTPNAGRPVTGASNVSPQLGRRGGGWVAVQIVLLAAIFLSALVGLGWPSSLEPPAYAIGGVLMVAGFAMLVAGGGALARVSAVTPFPAPRPGSGLQTSGIYRLVRHPMYGGGIAIALGWSTIFGSPAGLALTVVLTIFADLKARREEIWLEQRFAGYAEYRRLTRRKLIPFVW